MNPLNPERSSDGAARGDRGWSLGARGFKAAALVSGTTLLLGLFGWLALRWVPLPTALFVPPPAQLELTDRHGVPLRIVRPQDRPFGQPVACFEIPQALIHATLAAEDKRFWDHPGVDWRSTLRAMWSLARYRRIVSGGSTITQQLIKMTQPRPRTFRAKFIEALQALRLEQVWNKQRILTEYYNRLDYGNLNTGCAAAAQFYCGKPLSDLSTAECALLAGLPQAPSRLNPLRHLDRARKRQQWILLRMFAAGRLTREEFDRARGERLHLATPQRAFRAPHFADLILQQSESWMPKFRKPAAAPVHGSPGAIRTTLDLNLNRFVQESLQRQIARLRPQHVGNAAAVVIDNRSNEVLALVGSQDYFAVQAGQVNGAWAPRSAGSTFKPFTYLLAFERGATPASIVADVPSEFTTGTGLFSPVNYDHHCHGPVRYRLALANSLNIAAVKVLASIGGPAVLQARLQACGLTTLTDAPEHYGLGLTIGNAEVRLLELANAYACLARLGEFRPYTLLPQIEGSAPSGPPGARQVCDAAASFLIADILSDNAARTSAFGAESSLRFDFPVACKTGTSSDFRDNWAFGYTPEFTVGVWVGNFDGSSMQHISGVTGAAPILHDIVEHLHQCYGTSWYAKPDCIVDLPVHPVTGKRPADQSAERKRGWVIEKFVAGQLPRQESSNDYDSRGLVRLSAEYHDWFTTGDNSLIGQAVLDKQDSTFRILFPLPGTRFFLDPDLPDQGKRIRLRVEGAQNALWQSETLECQSEPGQAAAILASGRHRLIVHDQRTGVTRETWIDVVER